jgi:hypothetical protein
MRNYEVECSLLLFFRFIHLMLKNRQISLCMSRTVRLRSGCISYWSVWLNWNKMILDYSSVTTATGIRAVQPGFDSRQGQEISSPPRPDRLWGQPSLRRVLEVLSMGVKWPERTADHSPPNGVVPTLRFTERLEIMGGGGGGCWVLSLSVNSGCGDKRHLLPPPPPFQTVWECNEELLNRNCKTNFG